MTYEESLRDIGVPEPKLRFHCEVCREAQDSSEIRQDFAYGQPLRCRDYFCNGPVKRAHSSQQRPAPTEQLSRNPTSQPGGDQIDTAPNRDSGQDEQHQREHEKN